MPLCTSSTGAESCSARDVVLDDTVEMGTVPLGNSMVLVPLVLDAGERLVTVELMPPCCWRLC